MLTSARTLLPKLCAYSNQGAGSFSKHFFLMETRMQNASSAIILQMSQALTSTLQLVFKNTYLLKTKYTNSFQKTFLYTRLPNLIVTKRQAMLQNVAVSRCMHKRWGNGKVTYYCRNVRSLIYEVQFFSKARFPGQSYLYP